MSTASSPGTPTGAGGKRPSSCGGYGTKTSERAGAIQGAEEIQMRRVAGYLFGFIKPDTLKGVTG